MTTLGHLGVLGVALAVLAVVLVWAWRTRTRAFFYGLLAGTGLVLSFDIVWVHWIFGLHHLTNSPDDLILEPLFVVAGVVLLWIGLTRGHES